MTNSNKPLEPPKGTTDALSTLARLLYPSIMQYFDSPEGRRDFELWLASKSDQERPQK